MRAESVQVGYHPNLAACFALARPYLASIPIKHGGTFASRDTILARATFSRSTIAPRVSRPTRCSVFFPGSIPMVTTAVVDFGMGWCSFCCPPYSKLVSWAGARPVHPILGHGRATLL